MLFLILKSLPMQADIIESFNLSWHSCISSDIFTRSLLRAYWWIKSEWLRFLSTKITDYCETLTSQLAIGLDKSYKGSSWHLKWALEHVREAHSSYLTKLSFTVKHIFWTWDMNWLPLPSLSLHCQLNTLMFVLHSAHLDHYPLYLK